MGGLTNIVTVDDVMPDLEEIENDAEDDDGEDDDNTDPDLYGGKEVEGEEMVDEEIRFINSHL